MRVCGCVILYNPSQEIIKNVNSYPEFLDRIYLLDNSQVDNSYLLKEFNDNRIEYLPFFENKGIAYALKKGTEFAINNDYDYILTMDQDSLFPKEKSLEIYNYLVNPVIYNSYGIIGLNFNSNQKIQRIVNCKYWLTSGNFINIKFYKQIHGFKEELFIDYVDLDLGNQFYQNSIKVGYLNHISLKHSIGNPIHKKILFFKFTCMNHSPIRYYYRYRNSRYLWRENKLFYFNKYIKERTVNYLKMILFEDNRKEKKKMIKKGLYDAKNKKLGPYVKEIN